MGFLVGGGGDSYVSTGFTTSHGYQFNSWLYVGGGTGFVYNLNWKPLWQTHKNDKSRYVIPLFAEVRLDAKWNRFTPYFSAQIGANVAERGGFYFSPMIGYRFNWGRRSAINIGLGATLYGNTYSYLDHTYIPGVGHIDEAVKDMTAMWCRLQPASASSSNCRDDTCLIDRGIIYMALLFRWKSVAVLSLFVGKSV